MAAISGRSDGRLAKYIYASGQGGVIDYRLSAWDAASPEKASEVFEKVKNGSYRGEEKLKFTKVVNPLNFATVTITSGAVHHNTSQHEIVFGISEGDTETFNTNGSNIFIVGDNGETLLWTQAPTTEAKWGTLVFTARADAVRFGPFADSDSVETSRGAFSTDFNTKFPVGTVLTFYAVTEIETDVTVSGEFTQTDVIGDPANILQTDALKDGWLGSWIPKFPTGAALEFKLTKKSLVSTCPRIYSGDLGSTWTFNAATALDTVKNIHQTTLVANGIMLLQYTAFAKQTKESTNLPVLHGEAGVESVLAASDYRDTYGALFVESLLGKIATDSGANTKPGLPLLGFTFDGPVLHTDALAPLSHGAVNLPDPSGGAAVKALPYQVADNNQASLNFAYNELVYNVDWGDDSTIKIVDGQSTYTNDNGDTCLYGTDQLALPYGWVKNNI